METFVDKRSKNATIKRMIELGLIAERSEILPSKRKRSRKSQPNEEGNSSGSGSDSNDSDDEDALDSRPVRVTIKTTKKPNAKTSKPKQQPKRELPKIMLNASEIQSQIVEIDDDLKTHFDWLKESLNDAAEDADDGDLSDPSDGVPLVPFSMSQKEALANPQFKKLLQTLGLQEPIKEMVSNHQENFS